MEIKKSDGLNSSEQKLIKLGEKVFLGLWSYPNVYYEPGKELADLLVVCDKNVLIFSDKNIKFDTSKEINLAWQRWHKRAILESIEQLRRAERIIKKTSNNIFLDAKCTKKLPIVLPNIDEMNIHLICVANGATVVCKEYFTNKRSTGSLPFSSDINLLKEHGESLEFYTTDYDKTQTFIHVFDDFTFPFVLNELDTITDFVKYLTEKEMFIRNAKSVNYSGEEELLLHYMTNYDYTRKCHTFIDKTKFDIDISSTPITLQEGGWDKFREHPQYMAKKKANKVSYYWDNLIQMASRFYFNGIGVAEKPEGSTHEGAVRYMALENRTHRKTLSENLYYLDKKYPMEKRLDRKHLEFMSMIYNEVDQAYIFLFVEPLPSDTYEQYAKNRREHLKTYALCLKAQFVSEKPKKKLNRIIGIAMEPSTYLGRGSTDFLLVDCSDWDDEKQSIYDSMRKEMDIWNNVEEKSTTIKIEEYPQLTKHNKKIGRNDPCSCGSGKKYKRCCLNKSS
ncbi:SEC-C domain-containing protein [Elusimicrobiota bacterium]